MIFDNLTEEQKSKVIGYEHSNHIGSTLLIDRNIDLSNEKYDVIEVIREKYKDSKKTNLYNYVMICKDCGHIIKISKSSFKQYTTCAKCNQTKYYNDFVGFENIAFKVIDFEKSINRRLYYKVQCKNCNSILIMRKDNILKATKCHCINCIGNNKTPSKFGPLNVYKYYYKEGARSRGFNWEISDEEFYDIISKPCFYCGSEPKPIQSLKRYIKVKESINVNGVDRLDSNLGYTIENCVPCCSMCNRMKMNYTLNDFVNHVYKISNYCKGSTTIENLLNSNRSEQSTP